jgi:hypothetical protein
LAATDWSADQQSKLQGILRDSKSLREAFGSIEKIGFRLPKMSRESCGNFLYFFFYVLPFAAFADKKWKPGIEVLEGKDGCSMFGILHGRSDLAPSKDYSAEIVSQATKASELCLAEFGVSELLGLGMSEIDSRRSFADRKKKEWAPELKDLEAISPIVERQFSRKATQKLGRRLQEAAALATDTARYQKASDVSANQVILAPLLAVSPRLSLDVFPFLKKLGAVDIDWLECWTTSAYLAYAAREYPGALLVMGAGHQKQTGFLLADTNRIDDFLYRQTPWNMFSCTSS